MRMVAQALRADCKVTVFLWNSKYLIKFEQAGFEQTFKLSELDLSDEKKVHALIADDAFVSRVSERFLQMRTDLGEAVKRVE